MNCSMGRQVKDNHFSYENVTKDHYETGRGGIISLTIERGESYSGSLTEDSQYLVYAGNKHGNYDIFVRPMNQVESAPVTIAATNQTQPAISPDGSKVAYIEDEIDPDGDLVVLNVDLDKIYKNYLKGKKTPSRNLFFGAPKNLTNSEEKKVRSRESNPAFSPNGKMLAFASDRTSEAGSPFGPGISAISNIWVIDPSSGESRKITTRGGVMPSFSPDGKKIVYISYQVPNSNGNVFEVDIESGETRQLTTGTAIDLSPSYNKDHTKIFFTRIEKDTNQDGRIDRKDNGVIISKDLPPKRVLSSLSDTQNDYDPLRITKKTQNEVPLTLPNDNIFDTRYTSFYQGGILFAKANEEDINIGLIPEHGIIPKRKTIEEQYSLIKSFYPSSKKAPRDLEKEAHLYSMASEKVNLYFPAEPMSPFFTPRAEFDLFKWEYENNRVSAGTRIKKIKRRLANKETYYRILIDLEILAGNVYPFGIETTLVPAKTQIEYLRKMIKNRSHAKFYMSPPKVKINAYMREKMGKSKIDPFTSEEEKQIQNEIKRRKEIERNYFAILRRHISDIQKKSGNEIEAANTNASLIRTHPHFYNSGTILYEIGNSKLISDIPPEFLFILYPDRYSYADFIRGKSKKKNDSKSDVNLEPDGLQNQKEPSDETPKNNKNKEAQAISKPKENQIWADWENALRQKISQNDKSLVQRSLYKFFQKLTERKQIRIREHILKKYPRKTHNEIHLVAGLGVAKAYCDALQEKESEKQLAQVVDIIPKGGFWENQYLSIRAINFEVSRKPQEAFANHLAALMLYKKEFKDEAFLRNKNRTFEFYLSNAEKAEARGDFTTAWGFYKQLNDLNMVLFERKIDRANVERSSTSVISKINSVAVRAWRRGNPLAEDILDYYKEKLSFAQYSLNYAFIYGQAYLNASIGMQEHSLYDKVGILTNDQKESVLTKLKSSEQGFKWSIFANPDFADSYIMLGWIYQYIDTKKQTVLDPVDNTLDKDKYESIYQNLFPDHLFEENIRLYQQFISRFKNEASSELTMSFYLNMGNNYFLLNNYAKAQENYQDFQSINEKSPFNWESEEQKALFYYHLGKTNYFTGNYDDSIKNLQTTYNHYEKLAPLKASDPDTNSRNQQKREKILRYLALTYDLAGNPAKATDSYQKIIQEQNEAGVKLDRSFLHMQIGKLAYENENYDLAYENIVKASEYISTEPKIPVPEFKMRVKMFGIYEPWTTMWSWISTLSYDTVYVGNNHLAFPLPTINRRQYIASVKAEILEKRGLLEPSRQSLKELESLARADKSNHGKETLLAVKMRLGRINYLMKDMKSARDSYNEAIKMASEQEPKDLATKLKARKNLLTIASQQMESPTMAQDERRRLAEKESESLNSFVDEYQREKLQSQLQRKQESNKSFTLTEAESNEVILDSQKNLYRLILYDGTFQSYVGFSGRSQIPPKAESPEQYLSERKKWFEPFSKAIHLNKGEVPSPDANKNTVLLQNKDEHLKMILALNLGQIYDYLNVPAMAEKEYFSVYDRADIFSFNMLKSFAAMRMARLQSDGAVQKKLLEESWQILENNQYILREHPEVYDQVGTQLSNLLRSQNNLQSAVMVDIKRRNFAAIPVLENRLQINHPEGKIHYRQYQYLNLLESARHNDLKRQRVARKDTEPLEKELLEISQRKEKLKSAMAALKFDDPIFNFLFPEKVNASLFSETQGKSYYCLPSDENHSYFVSLDSESTDGKTNVNFSLLTLPHPNRIKDVLEERRKKNELDYLIRDLPWLKKLAPAEVVYVDDFWKDFPFEKVWLKPVSKTRHFLSQILFDYSQSVSANSMLVVSPKSTSAFSGTLANYSVPSLRVSRATNIETIKPLLPGTSVLDYESIVSGNLVLENLNPIDLQSLLNDQYAPTALILSIRLNGNVPKKTLGNFEGAMEILAASRGVGVFAVHNGSRKDGAEKISAFLSGKTDYFKDIHFAGKASIVAAWQEDKKTIPAPKTIELAKAEKENFTSLNDIFIKEQKYKMALGTLERAFDADKILNKNKFAKKSQIEVLDEELFHRKDLLLLKIKQEKRSSLEWQKHFKTLRLLKDKERLNREFTSRIVRLFQTEYEALGIKTLEEKGQRYITRAKQWENILAAYHLTLLHKGETNVSVERLPLVFTKAIQKHNIFIEENWQKRITGFAKDEKKSEIHQDWIRLALINKEFTVVDNLYKGANLTAPESYTIMMALSMQLKKPQKFSTLPAKFWDFQRELSKMRAYHNEAKDEAALIRQTKALLQISEKSKYKNRLFNVIYNQVLHEIFYRQYSPKVTQEVLNIVSEHAEKRISIQKNKQQKAYLQIWANAKKIPENPNNALLKVASITKELSEGNQGLVNQLLCLGATYKPQELSHVNLLKTSGYFFDKECSADFSFIHSISKNPAYYNAKNHRQFSIGWKYLRESKKTENAIRFFAKYDTNEIVHYAKRKHSVRGFVPIWEGESDTFVFNGTSTNIEPIKESSGEALKKLFKDSANELLYIPQKLLNAETKALDYTPNLVRTSTLNISVQPFEIQSWKETYQSELSSLIKIILGNPLEKRATLSTHNRITEKPKGDICLYDSPIDGSNDFTTMQNDYGVWKLVYLNKTNKGAYLTFSEEFIKQSGKAEIDIPKAYQRAQRIVREKYPLVEDHAGIWLLYQAGKEDK